MFYIGVNFDITNISAAVVDENRNIIAKESVPTLRHRKLEVIIADMAALVEKTAKKAGLDLEKDINHVGIGCYGSINRKTGVLVYSSYFGLRNIPLIDEIKKFIKIPVFIENDANCYALAESRMGATKGLKNSVLVTIGTAISGGIIVRGEIYHGAFYGAGEFGHHVVVLDGEKCECGRNGCWAAYASSTALVRDARIAAIRHPESKMFEMVNGDVRLMSYKIPFEAAMEDDVYAKDIVYKYARYIALGLINIINILQPDAIAIGGKMFRKNEGFLDVVSKLVSDKTFGQKDTKILLAEMDYDGVLIGASMLEK